MIANLLEGLPFPLYLYLTSLFPVGICTHPPILRLFLFFLGHTYIKNGWLLVFLPEVKETRVNMIMDVETYDFAIAKDWWSINEMPLYLDVDNIHMVRA